MLVSPNGRRYIGQSIDYEKRLKHHYWASKTYPYKLYRSIRKYGWENFKKEILLYCNDEHLDDYEKKFIAQLDTLKTGLNSTAGGTGTAGLVHTAEHHRKIAASNRGKKRSVEAKDNMARAAFNRKRTGSVKTRKSLKGLRYRANVMFNRKHIHIGTYDTEELAREAIDEYLHSHLHKQNKQQCDSVSTRQPVGAESEKETRHHERP